MLLEIAAKWLNHHFIRPISPSSCRSGGLWQNSQHVVMCLLVRNEVHLATPPLRYNWCYTEGCPCRRFSYSQQGTTVWLSSIPYYSFWLGFQFDCWLLHTSSVQSNFVRNSFQCLKYCLVSIPRSLPWHSPVLQAYGLLTWPNNSHDNVQYFIHP